jgi:hypothetical protein
LNRVSAALVALLLFIPAIHGVAEDGPTDADLKAGYCSKVLQSQSAIAQSCQRRTSDSPEVATLRDQECRKEQDNIQRVKDYLAARGYLFGPRDPTPVLIAGNRGDADFKACVEFANHPTPEASACMNKCEMKMLQSKGRSDFDFIACDDACPNPDSCRRLWTCNNLSFLPF